MPRRRAMRLNTGAQLNRNGVQEPVKQLQWDEKTKLPKQKTRRQRLKRKLRNCRRKRLICKPNWMQIRTRLLPCKSGQKNQKLRQNRRRVQPLLPRQQIYRRNLMMPAVRSTARKKKKLSYPQNFTAIRTTRPTPRKGKNAGNLASAEPVCAALFLQSIRRTISWFLTSAAATESNRTLKCSFCGRVLQLEKFAFLQLNPRPLSAISSPAVWRAASKCNLEIP